MIWVFARAVLWANRKEYASKRFLERQRKCSWKWSIEMFRDHLQSSLGGFRLYVTIIDDFSRKV